MQSERIKGWARKAAVPAIIGAGIAFPVGIHETSENLDQRNEQISELLDTREAHFFEGVALIAGTAFILNSYQYGKKYDEKKLHALRLAGPILMTAAAGSAVVDSQTTIDYSIPAGLALGSSYAFAATNILSTLERTTDKKLILSSISAGLGVIGGGVTLYLAAADKL